MAILDGTVVTLALPHMTSNLSEQQRIVNAYTLSMSSLILLGGSLGDIFGRKRVYLTGLVGFGLGSLLCALAPSVSWLIAFRLVQGVAAALLVPGALAIINSTFPSKERSHAIGRWTSWTSLAVLAAPVIGGVILASFGWRWIFLINLPLVVACFALGVRAIDESRDTTPRRVDVVGAILGAATLSLLSYGLIEGPSRGWPLSVIASVVASVITAIMFVAWEKKARDPMVKLSLFHTRNFTGSNLMTFLMYGALGGMSFALTIYLQQALGYSALAAGMTMIPASVLLMLFSGRVGRLAGIYGARLFMTVGPMVAGLGIAWLYFVQPGSVFMISILPGILLFGIGLTLLVAPLTATVMASVRDEDSGIASAINNAVARSAGLIIVAVLGVFGAANAFHFGMILCAGLAIAAGIVSYVYITPAKSKGV